MRNLLLFLITTLTIFSCNRESKREEYVIGDKYVAFKLDSLIRDTSENQFRDSLIQDTDEKLNRAYDLLDSLQHKHQLNLLFINNIAIPLLRDEANGIPTNPFDAEGCRRRIAKDQELEYKIQLINEALDNLIQFNDDLHKGVLIPLKYDSSKNYKFDSIKFISSDGTSSSYEVRKGKWVALLEVNDYKKIYITNIHKE